MTRHLHRLALLLLTLLLSAPVLAGDPRSAAILAFQRQQVHTLASHDDGASLLAAALLARPLGDQPDALDFHTLIERAARAAPAQAAITWLRLADCDRAALTCPNAHALAQLRRQAADNAAVWLLSLGQALHDGDRDGARHALQQAAAASHYDDYAGHSLQALANALDAAATPPSLSQAGLSPLGARAVLVFALGEAQPQPALRLAAQLCAGSHGLAMRSQCLGLGRLLAKRGSSPLARSLGLHLLQTGGDAADRARATRARRTLVWQVQQFAALTARADRDDTVARGLLQLARRGQPEMQLMQQALHHFGIPPQPPAGWDPHAPARH